MKIENDKYYTPVDVANHCIDKALEIIGEDNISEVIEPSVGAGSFLTHPKLLVHFAYDIKPECTHEITHIKQCDFLKEKIVYLPGRLIIGNPPYGRCLNLAQKFFKHSAEIGDYVAFILPISQLNNTQSMYEFDLIYSEDLGIQDYSGRELHCCFNIYRRPISGELNPKPITDIPDITIYRQDSANYKTQPFDVRMCYWGNGSIGKILSDEETYSGEYKIQIHNEALKDRIKEVLTTYDWKSYVNAIAMKRLKQWQIIQVLLNEIPELNKDTPMSKKELW